MMIAAEHRWRTVYHRIDAQVFDEHRRYTYTDGAMMKSTHCLICFDAGFTLIEPVRTTAATLAAVLASMGIPPTDAALQRAWDAADAWFLEEYQRPGNDTWSADERIQRTWLHHHGLMLRELGIDDPDQRLADAVIAAYAAPENWRAYPDVPAILDGLRRRGRVLGVVSDWSSRLPALLDALGLSRRLDFVLTSVTAGAAKPAAAFYRMALERAGVAPHEALMVGDSYEADVLGARSAGMDAVLLDRYARYTEADVPIIRSLEELAGMVG
jgi:putative hydrolase of the HAD superfamily